LESYKNAYMYFKKIYDFKELINNDKFSYFSSAYYLYKITKDYEYLNEITRQSAKAKFLTENEKSLVVDTLILQQKYDYALQMIETMQEQNDLKKAMLYIKLRDYSKALTFLNVAYDRNFDKKDRDKILWIKLFRDLKANDLNNITETIFKIEKRERAFEANKALPLRLYFNKQRFTSSDYLQRVTSLDEEFVYKFLYYFAPFIFEDNEAMELDEKKGFILKTNSNLEELNLMIKYNKDFVKISNLDPVYRVQILQQMIDAKFDTNAYEYYNLALAYAQVYDYNNAYKYFSKAYSLEHGNKLYGVMKLVTAQKLHLKLDKIEKEFLEKSITSANGTYKYVAQYIYKIFVNSAFDTKSNMATEKQKTTIFVRSLEFLQNVQETQKIDIDQPLFKEYKKDQLVYLLSLAARQGGESDYAYISRMQDEIPKSFNHNFIKYSFVVSDYYVELLKALGIFQKANLIIEGEFSPSYLRTRAIGELYGNNPKNTIEIVEYIQKKYDLKSVDIFYILAAAYFQSDQRDFAYEILTELEFLYHDTDAKFLGGIKLLQDLKLNTVTQYFQTKFYGKFIDFELVGFDEYLESL
ncbi:MAG: hypothetical protein IE909_06770, partial [Campylobacterales bacterium]|nr:hypothetical protein [Campylobacterales bacterium]